MKNPPWMMLAIVVLAATNAAAAEPPVANTPVDPDHLTLETAEQLFREHSRELLAARRAVESAEADRVIAAQRPNPTLSGGASSRIRLPGERCGTRTARCAYFHRLRAASRPSAFEPETM